jgi:chromosome segregation ATPase
MSSFFKKALGVFMEFEDTPASAPEPASPSIPSRATAMPPMPPTPESSPARGELSKEDVDKFEKHFSSLMERSNLPGPDYYEFFKMMETLEAHIVDEGARMAAVFATLSIQGMTKEKLLETAAVYSELIEKDNAQFHQALTEKSASEVEGRQQNIKDLESKIQQSAEQIQLLTKQITEYQTTIASLNKEVAQERQRLEINGSAYQIASKAMSAKITSDIQKITSYI